MEVIKINKLALILIISLSNWSCGENIEMEGETAESEEVYYFPNKRRKKI